MLPGATTYDVFLRQSIAVGRRRSTPTTESYRYLIYVRAVVAWKPQKSYARGTIRCRSPLWMDQLISIPYRIYAAIYLYYVGQLISNDILCGPGRLLVRRSSFTLPLSVTSATVHERVQAPAQALKFQASCTNLSLLQDSETLLTANLSDRDHSWQNCIPISLDFIAS